jgi:2-(1,2-epoxy-1,2-dihydrophenyl)acetyl-CoA isomerase
MSTASAGYVSERAGGVATLTFNRPEVGNAVSAEMVPGLLGFFRGARSDPSVRCIIIKGVGKHFSTGGDLATYGRLLQAGPDALQREFEARLTQVADLVEAVLAFDRPIIAAVKGAVAGAGLMFALAADFVIADESAMFLFSHQKVGLPPDGGVSWLLPRLVGHRTASRLILTAARVMAAEAERIGLVSQLVASDRLEQEAADFAAPFVTAPQAAVKYAKSLLRSSLETDAAQHLRAERAAIVACVGDPDFAEGVTSFLEKRQARFPSTMESGDSGKDS